MSIAAIIVNYQAGALILSHLDRTLAELRRVPGSRLYIVDNASPNGDAALLEQRLADIADVTFIAAPKNGGFSYGNNIGFRQARADAHYDHFYLLNPDAYPLPGCFTAMIDFFRTHPSAGVVGSRLQGEDGQVQRSAFRFMSLASEFESGARTGLITRMLKRRVVSIPAATRAHEADWVCGASMLVRASVLDQVGLMDEDYFLYFEEVDWQRAIKKAGHSIWYLPEAQAVHLVGQSTDMKNSKQRSGAVPSYWFDSRRHYFIKNHGRAYAAMADLALTTGKAIYSARGLFGGDARADLNHTRAGLKAAAAREQESGATS